MATQRVYVNATIFGVPIVGMRNLWEPSTQYKGQQQQKPSYIAAVIIRKTAAHWSHEPVMAAFTAACMELYTKAMAPYGIAFEQVVWPVKDGDVPSEPGRAPAEWMKGHWYLTGSSSSPINVEIVQGGKPVKLANRVQVKPGDNIVLSGALAVKQNDPRGVKFYANNVVFVAPGEEIAVGNGVTGTELMEQARLAGMNITGFAPAGGASFGQFTQTRQGGFMQPPMVQPGQTQPGFGGAPQAPMVQPGFQQGGPSPQAAFGQPATLTTTYPSNGAFVAPAPLAPPAQVGGFAPPAGFGPPR